MLNFTKNTIEEKLINPFWRTFVLSWITWNWQVWYVTFFVSEEKVGNKIEYIRNIYNYFDFYGLFPILGFLLNWIIMPLLISYLIIFIITENIVHKFLDKNGEIKNKENTIHTKYLKIETDKFKAAKENFETKKELEEIKETSDEKLHKEWDDEFINMNNKYKNSMNILSDFIYTKKGEINGENWNRHLSADNEILFDSLGLIKELGKEMYGGKTYSLTEKGKYFIKKSTI